jgi:hypothetical protein
MICRVSSSVKPTFEDILGKQLHPSALNKANFPRQVPLKVEGVEESADEHFLDKTHLTSALKHPSQVKSGATNGHTQGSVLPQPSPVNNQPVGKTGAGSAKSPVKSQKVPALKTPTNGRPQVNGTPTFGTPKGVSKRN